MYLLILDINLSKFCQFLSEIFYFNSNLSDSSSSNDDSSDSDFEAVPQKKVHKSFKSSWNHASNIKKKVYTRNSYKASIRATASTKSKTT